MNAQSTRRLSAALALAVGIGLCQPAMAQRNGGEEGQTPNSEEETRPATLEEMWRALQAALEKLRNIEHRIAELQAIVQNRKRLAVRLRLATGLSRSTETPVYSVEAGSRAIALARAALDAANAALAAARTDREAAQAAVDAARIAWESEPPDPGLAELLPDPDIRFPALSATLGRDYDERRVFPTDDAHVTAISSDGGGGFHVTYTIDGEEQTVHYAASDWRGTSYRKFDEEGESTHLLWPYTNSFRRTDTNRNQGSTEFRYFDGHGNLVPGGYRFYMSYGARTEADGIPAGAAAYVGRMSGELWSRTDPAFATGRSFISGSLNLTADFGDGAIEGRIDRIYIDPPGDDNGATLPSSTRFDIEHGRISDGQFTATLTGVDGNADAATDRTVAGYRGDILGEFYGPEADEVGGVLNAESDAHDSVIGGWFGGRKVVTSVPDGEVAVSSAASHQDFAKQTTALSSAAVTAVAGDGANGLNLTYTIGTETHRLHLGARDFGSDPDFPTSFHETVGNRKFYLFDSSGSFTANPEFSHFSVNGWVVSNVAADGRVSDFYHGRVVYGAATDPAAMPSGSATYTGRMFSDRQPSGRPGRRNRTYVRGDLTLNADFDRGTVGGSFDNLEFDPPGNESWQPATSTRSLSIENGTISGNALAADVVAANVFDGEMEGRFFGPDAAEVGGTFKGTALTDNAVVYGYFGGKKQ